ncbi:MAG: response regulator, partial [Enterocloster asparagiformis]|nr:response regulator [Enterocloster asparagiformis]
KEELEAALALAEEASRAKSDFLSAMSHDIRTPLNAVIGMTELAFAHIGDRERVEDCLQTISLSSRHLLSLINNVLDMAKIERSSLVFNRMKIALPELVEQVASIIALQAQNSGIRFSTDVNHIRHETIFGDPLRLNQILLNILGNAVKFTPKGGSVEFRIDELPASSAPGMARYRFVVQDTGIGMGAEFAEHIFEPFSRGGDSGRAEGGGLGLSITKGLIDLMGGEISVETREHMGSTFRVELEFEPADAGPGPEYGGSPEDSGQERALSGRRFLVAEDNAINVEILCELLQMQGALSVVRSDGAQALAAFQEAAVGTYDAILMDIQMPNMNGYEAARAIRSLDRKDAGNIPIIAMTANAFAEDVQAALAAGMTAHIAKPIDLGILLFELNRILR